MRLKQKLLSYSRVYDEKAKEKLKNKLENQDKSAKPNDRKAIKRQLKIVELIGNSNHHMELNQIADEINAPIDVLKKDMKQLLNLINKK